MKKILYLIIPALLLTTISGCGNNGCEEVRESFCYAQMTSLSGAKINPLYAFGIGQGGGEVDTAGVATDKEMLNASNPSSLEFILNPDSTVTDIRLQMNITLDGDQFQYDDTIHFVYEPHPFFINMDCGCSMYFSLKEVTHTNHFLRNITIKNNEVTNEQTLNIVIEY